MEICLKYPVQLVSGKALDKMVLRRAKVADLREASRGSDKPEDQEVALLARWFRFPPSEIDGLAVDDFLKWCRIAAEQIRAERPQD